jgi:DNA-binding IclR family transcriptional regulator
MRNGTPKIGALTRSLAMLDAVIVDGGRNNTSQIAGLIGMPVATAHRQVTTLVAQGYLRRSGAGRHVAGPRLLALLHHLDEGQVIANVAAPLLHRLAARVRSVVQLGTLANDMVTYRIKTGRGANDLFTRVDMQLEAYCSGIGKVLLAHLPPAARDAYLAGGPFVALTDRTITDPACLRAELAHVREQGFAIDNGEIAHGLRCMAVPLRNPDGTVLAAISVSQSDHAKRRVDDEALLQLLRETAGRIEYGAFGR